MTDERKPNQEPFPWLRDLNQEDARLLAESILRAASLGLKPARKQRDWLADPMTWAERLPGPGEVHPDQEGLLCLAMGVESMHDELKRLRFLLEHLEQELGNARQVLGAAEFSWANMSSTLDRVTWKPKGE